MNGWGYKDTEFVLEDDGSAIITGNRYAFSGQKMPKLKEWCEKVVGVDTTINCEPQKDIPIDPPIVNEAFVQDV